MSVDILSSVLTTVSAFHLELLLPEMASSENLLTEGVDGSSEYDALLHGGVECWYAHSLN